MASKIKVDNIENQCGGAVVTKCGATTTISGSVVKADDIQAADGGNLINQCGTTITLGASGDTINLASGASQTGFGRTGTVDWDTTAKTASFTAVSGNGYFVNTTSGAITVTLPAGSAGDIVGISDYASTFQTNNVTITPNGTDKINGINANAALSTQGLAVSLVYVDDTRGWKSVTGSDNDTTGNAFITATGGTITECGNCRIHTFTGPGTFTVTAVAACAAQNIVSHSVVAGGGGGGGSEGAPFRGGGGGGAGGYREVKNPVTPYTASPLDGYPSAPNRVTITAQAYPIQVGGGGAGAPAGNDIGTSGTPSIFSTVTSAGGGGGDSSGGSCGTAGSGGSGGGSTRCGTAGSGNTPPTSPSQGNPGGTAGGSDLGRGGGGAGAAGPNCGIPGGAGTTSSITASPVTYATGGTANCSGSVTANQGNGGRGGSGASEPGSNGGSGIVIIRYKYQ